MLSILNPKNVASLQTIELNRCNSNVYIQTMQRIEDPYRSSSRRRKITIIQKKRRKDGSVEHYRQNIFKDYDDAYAEKEAARLKSTLHNYRSSVRIKHHNPSLAGEQPQMKRLPDGTFVLGSSNLNSPTHGKSRQANDLRSRSQQRALNLNQRKKTGRKEGQHGTQ